MEGAKRIRGGQEDTRRNASHTAPKLALLLIRKLVRAELLEEIEGDLDEKFQKTLKERSALRARINYWFQTLNYLRPFALRKGRSNIKNTGMLSNNLKIGWRQMRRQKMYSAIKIGGFALGIAASLLITLYIKDELSFDTQPKHANQIYRVYQQEIVDGGIERWVWMQAPFAKTMKQMFPEVELVGRYQDSPLFGVGSAQIRREDQLDNTYEEGIAYFDQELLEILEVPFVYGQLKGSLDERNEVVITRKISEKYWPGENPVGKLIIYNNETNTPIKIGGVIEDHPTNASIQFNFMISMANRELWKGEQDNWYPTNYSTFARLREGADAKELALKMVKIAETYIAPNREKEFMEKRSYGLQPFTEIHLMSGVDKIDSPLDNLGDIRFVWMFGAVAIFIVLIACINFINLSTAKSASRAKEVGLRKTVGSYRSYLIAQFLVESLIFSVLSFIIGVLLAWVMLPNFNDLAGKSIVFPWSQLWFLPSVIIASIVVGLFAGIYPAFYLSSFKPAEVLKGSFARSGKNAITRSTLVVFQFTTSVVLIISTVVIYRQMDHIMNAKIGFDKEQVLILKGTDILGKQIQTFKQELLNMSSVKSVTISDYLPVKGSKRNGNGYRLEGDEKKEDQNLNGQFWRVDEDYAKTLGIKVIEGRFFDKNVASDSAACVITARFAKDMNVKEPIGTKVLNYQAWTVIGIVEDIQHESIRQESQAVLMVLPGSTNTMAVKLGTNDLAGTMKMIEDMWIKFSPHQPIRSSFMDETFAHMYDDVIRMGRIFTSFAVFAIVVACLGLFALSAFMVEQRGKEISIRLVLGASVRSVFQLLTMNFVKLVMISIFIAAPIAWYLMNEWLKGFTNPMNIGWDVFVLAGAIAVMIALGTISYQSVRAGLMNPIRNLRSE